MDLEKWLELINKIIDKEASSTVGIICKRIEVLSKNKSLNPALFKDLTKEIIYEQSRVLKKLIKFSLIPSVKFIDKNSKEEDNGREEK